MSQSDVDDTTPSRLSGESLEGDQTRFPNLGAVPDGPPPASSPEERRALADKLEADRLESERAKAHPAGAPTPTPPTDRLD